MDYKGYLVRVTALEGYAERITMMNVYEDFESIIGVKHKGGKGDNPHYHFVIKTNAKDQAVRVRLRKIFDQGKGNGHLSIKPWDGRKEAISYLFHEDTDAVLVLRHNVSDETIAEAKQINRTIQQMVLDAKTKAAWRAEDIVYEEICKDRGRRAAERGLFTKPQRIEDSEICAKLILVCLRTGKYPPQPWLARAMTERIQFRLCGGVEESEEELASRLAKNIFWKDT